MCHARQQCAPSGRRSGRLHLKRLSNVGITGFGTADHAGRAWAWHGHEHLSGGSIPPPSTRLVNAHPVVHRESLHVRHPAPPHATRIPPARHPHATCMDGSGLPIDPGSIPHRPEIAAVTAHKPRLPLLLGLDAAQLLHTYRLSYTNEFLHAKICRGGVTSACLLSRRNTRYYALSFCDNSTTSIVPKEFRVGLAGSMEHCIQHHNMQSRFMPAVEIRRHVHHAPGAPTSPKARPPRARVQHCLLMTHEQLQPCALCLTRPRCTCCTASR